VAVVVEAVVAVEVAVEEEEVEVEEEAVEGYRWECHLPAEPHPFTESLEEIPQPNSTEIGRKVTLFSSHLLFIEE